MRALILLCLLGLVSCSAFRPGAVKLTFYDEKTLKPIPNMQVEFREQHYPRYHSEENENKWLPGNSDTQYASTDQNGMVNFDGFKMTHWKIAALREGQLFTRIISFNGDIDKGSIMISNNELIGSDHKIPMYNESEGYSDPKLDLLIEIQSRWTDGTWNEPDFYPDCGGGGGYK